jgi:hypothetical protein
MPEEMSNDQEMVTVPAVLLQELLESNRDLQKRVGNLEARLNTGTGVELQPEADNRRTSLTVYAAGLARHDVQLYSATAYEAGKHPDERIEELTARSELEAAIRQLIRPHQLNFEAALGTRAETVKKLPAPPSPDAPQVPKDGNYISARQAYLDQHAKITNWTEPLPDGPYANVTYSVRYLPAQTKVKGSTPTLVSFMVTQNDSSIASPKDYKNTSQSIACEFLDGEPHRVTVNDSSRSVKPIDGRNRDLTIATTFWLGSERFGAYRNGTSRDTHYSYNHPSVGYEYLYDEAEQAFLKTTDRETSWMAEDYLDLLATYLNRIPTLGA